MAAVLFLEGLMSILDYLAARGTGGRRAGE